MKRRTKKEIDMDGAVATIKAAGWSKDSNEAKALIAAIEKKHEIAKGGSPELKEAREERNKVATTLRKINKMIKTVRDAESALADMIINNNPKEVFKSFNTLNKRVVNLGGKASELELNYMADLLSPSEEEETAEEQPVEEAEEVIVADADEENAEKEEEESPFGV